MPLHVHSRKGNGSLLWTGKNTQLARDMETPVFEQFQQQWSTRVWTFRKKCVLVVEFSGRVKHVPHRGPRRTSTECFQTSPYQSYFQASSSSNQKLNLPKFRPHLNTSLSYWNFLRGLSTSNVLKLSPLFICTSCTTAWCNWVMCRKTVKGVSSVWHLLTHITSQPVFDCM